MVVKLAIIVKRNIFLFCFFFVQAIVSKMLDQASAQFAASALVTTDQLLTFKSKEDLVVTGGLNGVVTGAGQWLLSDCYVISNLWL